ncbi:MAG: aminodeoxychorismate lyase [Flavipsychrobacter sp.]|nr:aminodeoxychorismate lyase [Flavipsychrobacter sp.]
MAVAKKKKSRGLLYVAIIIIVIGLVAVYKVFGPNTGSFTQGEYLYVHTGSDYEKLKGSLEQGGFIADMTSFDLLAKQAKIPEHVRAGKYRIRNGMSNFNIIRMLRNGRQTPVKLVINRLRKKQDLVNMICMNLEADSVVLKQLLADNNYLSEFGLDSNTAMCAIMPDTYDFFWNTSADKAFRKIEKTYSRFWDTTRKQQAMKQGLTQTRAIIIASIVDEETNVNDDKPKIASVYINRLQKGMRLQADPTVKFSIGDFTIRRVTGPMLQTVSPYNTYMYQGLPPGPICTPSVSSIEAVLMAPKTTYMYFCASASFNGRSDFATTFEEQMKNARAYQKALDARNIH